MSQKQIQDYNWWFKTRQKLNTSFSYFCPNTAALQFDFPKPSLISQISENA